MKGLDCQNFLSSESLTVLTYIIINLRVNQTLLLGQLKQWKRKLFLFVKLYTVMGKKVLVILKIARNQGKNNKYNVKDEIWCENMSMVDNYSKRN